MSSNHAPGGPGGPGPASGKAPATTAQNEFSRLVEILRVLRSPEGCPWDREQTLATLAPFVLEEAYETVEAIERGDVEALRGEIGDLIFEGVFLAQLCAERGDFSVADSLRHVNDKLVRRHPHVFARAAGDAAVVETAGQVVEQWEQIKARERVGEGESRAGALDGLPRSLPGLLAAYEIGVRAAAVGFDWDSARNVVVKIREEVDELGRAVEAETRERVAEEMGDLLFAIANLSRKLGVEPETALRAANRKFATRFRALEEEVERQGRHVADLPINDLERIWQRIKARAASL